MYVPPCSLLVALPILSVVRGLGVFDVLFRLDLEFLISRYLGGSSRDRFDDGRLCRRDTTVDVGDGVGLGFIDEGADRPAVTPAARHGFVGRTCGTRSEEHTSELQSLMRISYAVFCLKKKKNTNKKNKKITQYKTNKNITTGTQYK